MKAIDEQHIRDMEPSRRSNWIVHTVVMGNKAWKYRARQSGRYYTFIKFSPDEPTWPHDTIYTNVEIHEIVEGKMIVQDVPDYTRLISAAWEVVEKMNDYDFNILKAGEHCEVSVGSQSALIGKNVPELICKCALIAQMRGGSKE